MRVIVVGSANLDTTVRLHRHPGPGETVLAESEATGAGGKGLNQAVAAARAGARTRFVGAVGDDDAGRRLDEVLRGEGVDARLARSERPTGSAFVMVAEGGENAIVVVPGANGDVDALSGRFSTAEQGDVVLAQLEVPIEVVREAFRAAKERGATTVLNAAPSRALPAGVFALIDILVVNEHECLDLAGAADALLEDAAAVLAARVPTLVVTLGAEGALVRDAAGECRVPAFAVTAVDSTAAGDTFCGALASRLVLGDELTAAVEFGSAAAALSVQRSGASSSAPRLPEIEEFLAARKP